MFTLTNLIASVLAFDSIGRSLAAGQSVTAKKLASDTVAASRAGDLSVVLEAADKLVTLIAESDAQTEFDLPMDLPDSIIVIFDGKILTPTTDYVIDNEAGTLTYQHDSLMTDDKLYLTVTGEMVSGANIAPESMQVTRWDEETQALLKFVTFGDPIDDGANAKSSLLQIADPDGTLLREEIILKLTCDGDGVMSLGSGAVGTFISGSGSNSAIVKTSDQGQIDVKVTDATAEVCTVIPGVTQGSSILDCATAQEYDFS